MQHSDIRQFTLQMEHVGLVFNADFPAAKQHGYWIALEDLPLAAVQHACVEVLRSETFLPAPAVFRGYAREWVRQHTKPPASMSNAEFLQLREEQVSVDEIRELIASVWPEERERWDKDPIPRYEGEGGCEA